MPGLPAWPIFIGCVCGGVPDLPRGPFLCRTERDDLLFVPARHLFGD